MGRGWRMGRREEEKKKVREGETDSQTDRKSKGENGPRDISKCMIVAHKAIASEENIGAIFIFYLFFVLFSRFYLLRRGAS